MNGRFNAKARGRKDAKKGRYLVLPLRPGVMASLRFSLLLVVLAACAPMDVAPVSSPAPSPTTRPGPVVEQQAGPSPSAPTLTAVAARPQATAGPRPSATPAPTPTPSPEPSPVVLPTPTPLGPQTINDVPLAVIAPLDDETAANVRAIYARGQELGRDPRAFSKLGDSTLLNPHFLGPFDSGEYNLGEWRYLQESIDRYAGSFARHGIATHHGLHSWTVFDPMWANEEWCLPGEHLLACEVRLNNPGVLFVRLGSNDAGAPAGFRFNVKEVIEFALDNGIIPIIGTKADRFEGSNENNDILRALAAEYHVPLWEFDRLAETLPGRGLDDDGIHLVIEDLPHDFTDPAAFQRGHAMQDLSALVVLDQIRRVSEE